LLNRRSLCGLALLVGLGQAGFACKAANEHEGPIPQPTKAAPKDFDFDTSKPVVLPIDAGAGTDKSASSAKGRQPLSAQRLKELKRSLPALENARIIEALKATPHSRLARMSLCIALPPSDATTAFVDAFKRKKWKDLTVTKSSGNYSSFTGNSEHFRVNGSASQGEFSKCKKSEDESRVSLSFQERQPKAKASEKALRIAPGLKSRDSKLVGPDERAKRNGQKEPSKPAKTGEATKAEKPSGLR
jgi:hypothetical protein